MNRRLAIGAGVAAAVLATGGGVAVLAWPADDTRTAAAAETVTVLPPDPAAAPPEIKTELNTVDITASGAGAEVAERDTKRFSMLGVTWSDPAAAPQGTIQVRTRGVASGRWTGWQPLERPDSGPEGAEAAEQARRGGTEPLWVGLSDGVAARIAGGGSGLPAGLRLDLIDTGAEPGGQGGGEPSASASASPSVSPSQSSPAPPSAPASVVPSASAPASPSVPASPSSSASSAASASSSATPSVKPSATPTTTLSPSPTTVVPTSTTPVKAQFPPYVSRAGWSADETIVKSIAIGTEVRAVWVHHTATTNDYACTESASIVRGTQAYHVKSRGWSDVGYNYMVDKCGRLFEGRRGGVEKPVVGAHAVGFNTNYAGISVIGNYETAASNAAIETTLAQVAAARLGRYGYNPTSSVTVAAGVSNDKYTAGTKITVGRLSGHRDVDATVCPGGYLYARLPAIRARSVQMVTGLALKSVTGGGTYGGAYFVKKTAKLTWAVSTAAADVARFEMQVDGRTVSTLAGSARTATVNLTAGKHTVGVRAVHKSGSSALATVTVYGDVTAPTWTAGMAVTLRGGTYNAGSVPVALSLAAKDNLRFAGFTVTRPRAATLGATARSWVTTVKPGAATYTVTARDLAGNARGAQIARTVVLSAETAAKKTGSWTKKSSKAYLGGKALRATAKNRKLTWTFTGRSAALLFSRSAASGKVAVYVDGKKAGTLDLKSAGNLHRQAVWTRTLKPGKHTVAIVVLGTSGRPAVISDGLAYVK